MFGSQSNSVSKSVVNPVALGPVVELVVGMGSFVANIEGCRVVRGGAVGVKARVPGKARDVHTLIQAAGQVVVKGVPGVVFVDSVNVDDNVSVLFPSVDVEVTSESGHRVVVAAVESSPVGAVEASPVQVGRVRLVVGGVDSVAEVVGPEVVKNVTTGVRVRVPGKASVVNDAVQSGQPAVIHGVPNVVFVGGKLVDHDTVVLVPNRDVVVVGNAAQAVVVRGVQTKRGRAESNVTRMTA